MRIKATLGYQTVSQARAVDASSFDTLQADLAAQDDAFREVIVSPVEVVVQENPNILPIYEPPEVTVSVKSIDVPIAFAKNVDGSDDSDDSADAGWFLCFAVLFIVGYRYFGHQKYAVCV